jgi:primosomal protein N' (replication factor Y) (superfamily II helicase)
MKILFVHCRRGLYQLTKCKTCGHTFQCQNCDANLVTYRQYDRTLELVCHQCQTYYKYPNDCPVCHSHDVYSRFGGIEELVEMLQTELEMSVIRLDKAEKYDFEKGSQPNNVNDGLKNIGIVERQDRKVLFSGFLTEDITKQDQVFVHTRIFDLAIPYSAFDQIIFIQAENLLASADYLVSEEIMKALAEVLLQTSSQNKLIFDTNSIEIDTFQELMKVHYEHPENVNIYQWYMDFLEREKQCREKFGFPPFKNLLLITTQEKTYSGSMDKLKSVSSYLDKIREQLPDVKWSTPYPARFLKRKNMFSHHILLRFPRQYEHYSLLRKEITELGDLYQLQIRLNPRHLF